MAALEPARSKNLVIDKMIQLRLIADRSEILPSQRKRAKKARASGDDGDDNDADTGSDSDGSDDERESHAEPGANSAVPKRTKPAKKHQLVNKRLDYEQLRSLLVTVETQFQPVLGWLEESLNDAVDDLNDDVDGDPDDCVPLVPFTGEQRDGLEDTAVRRLLTSLGLQQPGDDEATSYWRIPQQWRADDLKLRARIVSGAFDFEAQLAEAEAALTTTSPAVESRNANDDDDSEEDYDFEANRRRQTAAVQRDELVYTRSDDEDDGPRRRQPQQPPSESAERVPPTKTKKLKPKSGKKFDIFDMIRDPADTEDAATVAAEAESAGERSDAGSGEDEPPVLDVSSRKPARRMVIEDSDEDDDDEGNSEAGVPERPASRTKRDRSQDADDSDEEQVANRTAIKRKRTVVIEDDDDDE